MSQTPKLEVTPSAAICGLCGTAYGKTNGYFYRNYSQIYKNNGYMTVCKTCVDNLYEDFLRECGDVRLACHQVCRKFNIYWNEEAFEGVLKGSTTRTVMAGYLTRVNVIKHRGKSYDDFLREISQLYNVPVRPGEKTKEEVEEVKEEPEEILPAIDEDELIEVDEGIKAAWGVGYSNKQYLELEERRLFWVADLKQRGVDTDDVSVAALLRQIVATELEINRDRADGKDVDKKVNTLASLVNSAILKPSQKKNEADISMEQTPFGVWINRFENERPLPKDENEPVIKKFIHTWLYGHLGKMLGLRNSYTQLYEDEMERLRVERPEYADEDDDIVLTDIFGKEVFEDDE